MASNFTLRSSHFCNLKTVLSDDRLSIRTTALYSTKINVKEQERHAFAKKVLPGRFLFRHASTYQISSLKWIPLPGALSSTASAADSGPILEDKYSLSNESSTGEMEFNRVNCLVWVLHESARIYALLVAVIEVELFLSHNRCNSPSPVLNILSPKTNFLGDLIESQLNTKNPKLVQWFRMVELPRMAGSFMPLFKIWTMEYAGRFLGSGRISCSLFSNSIEEALIELMTTTHGLVSFDKLHHLANEAGFEEYFLSHIGSKILPNKNVEDVEFWIGLVQRKLSTAFHRESVTKGRSIPSNKVQENSLATLALFAYLGRETRLFLSKACVVSFSYISTLSEYQLLMEVIIDEIGWLDFCAAYNGQLCQERKRSKHHPIQAEKEIRLRTVFTVCYDVINFPLLCFFLHAAVLLGLSFDSSVLSQGLLSTCLEDYWAAYDVTGSDRQKNGEKNGPDAAPCLLIMSRKSSLIMDACKRPAEFEKIEKHNFSHTAISKSFQQNFLRKSTVQLVAASAYIFWVLKKSQLLFVDISNTLRLLLKKLRGHKVKKRERRKMQRTVSDIATLIPVAILMLLPVSAVGHAAMFAAIKKYMPSLIPSPYSDERLDLAEENKKDESSAHWH
ncbi:hypothetical protein Pfo_019979 [Paulownia fortunei]|nr:hypothetical protein Pfo_019979 [Paulownia fortunei]